MKRDGTAWLVYRFFVCALVITSALLVTTKPASAEPNRNIYVGVYLHDVSRFELKDGVFDVDAEVWIKWQGDFDPEQLRVANASRIERIALGNESDSSWHSARYRIRGTLRGEFPMQRFPYDDQVVRIVFELPEHYGTLVPDLASSGMNDSFSVTDWLYEDTFLPEVGTQIVQSDLGLIANEGKPSTVHRVAYGVKMTRPIAPVALKLFLPLAIIVLVSIVALFLHPDVIGPRASIGVTALLSCFAFQFTVAKNLPDVSYVTLADLLFIIAYVTSASALITTIVTYAFFRREKPRWSSRLDRAAQVLLPAASLLAVFTAIPEPLLDPPEPPSEFPELLRHETSRDVIRIGTTRMPSALSSPVSRGAVWSLMPGLRRDGRAEPIPVFVEQRPAVDNDALAFPAGGELQVTWKVREGVKWSDGQPIVARDLSLPYEASPTPHVVKVETPDDRTLIITWDGRVSDALEAPHPWPSHVVESIYDEGGYDAVRQYRRVTPAPTLGPYELIEWVDDDHLVMAPNQHFLGPAPNIERLEVKYFDDREALIASFLAGEVDLTWPNSVTLEQARRVAETRPEAAHIRSSNLLVLLIPDVDNNPWLARPDVRRALVMAIDRERIARELYGDAGRVAHGPFMGEAPPEAPRVPYDPAAARAFFERIGAAGEVLPLSSNDSPVTRVMIGILKENLEAVGWRVDHRIVASEARVRRAREHGGLLTYVDALLPTDDPRGLWNLPLVDGDYPSDLRTSSYTDEVHAMIERERHTLYPERRRELRRAIALKTTESTPRIPLVFAAERVLVDPTLKNWDPGPRTFFGTGVDEWFFE